MRNLHLLAFSVPFLLAGCGESKPAPDKLTFRVIEQSADATISPTAVGGTKVIVAQNAAALEKQQNYRFTFTLNEGGSVELRARAKADLSGGIVMKFARTKDGITLNAAGEDLTADIKGAITDPSKPITADFDIHDEGKDSHSDFTVNGKRAGTAEGAFNVVTLQGTWGFVVQNGTVRDFAVGPAKYPH